MFWSGTVKFMSIQYGKWRFDGKPIDQRDIAAFKAPSSLYGDDVTGRFAEDGIYIGFGGFFTTKESRRETQPHHATSGCVFTWDGRLDNRDELIGLLPGSVSTQSTDVEIVAAAYEFWRADSFSRLLGDWAMSIWIPGERTLILAKDFLGSRHLFYHFDRDQLSWSTVLDPLVAAADQVKLDEEYIAGWFSMFPAAHLTPYRGIHSVPPASLVTTRHGIVQTSSYWEFDVRKNIRYQTDEEYEEHFRTTFFQSVRRRLRAENTVVAELSGGMDSSSIVCAADHILDNNRTEFPRLDTVSYYDDSEPNWNERPYFTKVEEQRGRIGRHIDVGSCQLTEFSPNHFAASPGSRSPFVDITEKFASYMRSQKSRVLLSGIGGDEVTGGVPTSTPELANLLTRAHFRLLGQQLKAWALQQRCPWFHLLAEVVQEFLPFFQVWAPEYRRPAPWLDRGFVRRNRRAVYGYPTRLRLFGSLPSFQENLSTLAVLRRHVAALTIPSDPHYEKRYPYLDRDLLEFLYAIPREQLVRPGQRRSLMRRALVGTVPKEILERKRKAYAARSPNIHVVAAWNRLCRGKQHLASGRLGIINADEFAKAVEKVRRGLDISVVPLFRTLAIEAWLSQFSERTPFRLGNGHAPEALVYKRSSL
jgi:asparagine synthase (glutamine-hydrolysing)